MLETHEKISLAITKALGVQGWSHLDGVLLAALATESPVLLVGPHGTAKTYLVERLAMALNLPFRHYNASLLNYDDLVGIPLPDESNQHLHFVSTPGAIWGAAFAFFDEISRCRPDLQNKLFPIIHERRVIGMELDELRHRWAAMNPPSPDEPDFETSMNELYLGSEPLDPALMDRFPFVVPVPNWKQLSKADRRSLIRSQDITDFSDSTLATLVQECAALIETVDAEYGEWLSDYIMNVMDLLDKARLPQSPRRARMMAQTIAAIHAARLVIEGGGADLEYSAELALLYGLPQNATEVPPTAASIVAVHKQAWEIVNRLEDDDWRIILEESDVIKRVVLAEELEFSEEDLSSLITQALAVDGSEARNVGLATAMFLAFRKHRVLTPAAWEPLAELAGRVLQPRVGMMTNTTNRHDMNLWNTIKEWAAKRRKDGGVAALEVNYVLGCFPDLWRKYDWQEALEQFKQDLSLFGVRGAE